MPTSTRLLFFENLSLEFVGADAPAARVLFSKNVRQNP